MIIMDKISKLRDKMESTTEVIKGIIETKATPEEATQKLQEHKTKKHKHEGPYAEDDTAAKFQTVMGEIQSKRKEDEYNITQVVDFRVPETLQKIIHESKLAELYPTPQPQQQQQKSCCMVKKAVVDRVKQEIIDQNILMFASFALGMAISIYLLRLY